MARNAGAEPWTFYEGPPTANGRPGTHHVEARVFKDVFPRFRTMQGYHVDRKAGWDCHGLPVEIAVEKELGFSGKGDIEAYGIAEFNARCRESVQRHVDVFEQMTDRMGYWVDMREPYRTMDPEYVESVWWALKQIFDKGLLVEDYRVAPYCPRCGTGLSDHELAQGYETVVDPSVYVRFPLTCGPYAGAGRPCWSGRRRRGRWSPTPRRGAPGRHLRGRPPTATRPLVVAEPLVEQALGEGWTGRRPVHRRRHGALDLPAPVRAGRLAARDGRRPDAHFVVLADYVTTEDGTGLVHQSPAFGADDLAVVPAPTACRGQPGRPDGHFEDDVPLVGGQFFKHADTDLVADLTRAACCSGTWPTSTPTRTAGAATPRCSTTPSRPGTSAPPQVKDALLRENERTNWFPDNDQVGPLRRLAAQQHRLGAVAQPLLGHAAADLALRRGPPDLRRLAGRARRAGRHRPVRARPAPAVRRRRDVRPARRAGGDGRAGCPR